MGKLLKFLIISFLVIFFTSDLYGLDRCREFITDVRNSHIRNFDGNFPWWYALGQIEQESACRANVTAFDAGMGLTQFMPATWNSIKKQMGRPDLNPYKAADSIEAQAFYMASIQKKENWTNPKRLWISYQIYNGGRGLLYKEYQRAGVLDWDLMKSECQRKKIKMNWGTLDLCEVNYDYSKKVYKRGDKYRLAKDHYSYRFW